MRSQDTGTAAAPLNKDVAAVLVLLGLVILVYLPAMSGGFVWDDEDLLLTNPVVQSAHGLYRIWCTTECSDYFPLTWTSFWIEWRLWGPDPVPYHVVNVLLHAVASVLLWRVLQRLGIPGAWLAAMLFAIHPVNVVSVAWISERKNTLSQAFVFLTLLAYLRYSADGRWGWYAASLAVFVLALLSKTSAVMLPVVLLGVVWWQDGRINWRRFVSTVPFFVVSAVLGLVTVRFQYHQAIGDEVVRPEGLVSRLAAAGWAVWFYAYKALVPLRLRSVYPRWDVSSPGVVAFIPTAAALIGLLVCWWYRNRWARPWFAGLGYFVVMLLPVLGFFDMAFAKYSLVADHLQYVALPGVVALSVGGAVSLWRRRRLPRVAGMVVAGGIVLSLSALTWHRGHVFRNNETFLRNAVAGSPASSDLRYNLGTFLAIQGNLTEAEEHLTEAVRLDPDDSEMHFNLARLLAETGRPEQAVDQYTEAMRCDPNDAAAHNSVGMLLVRMGRPEQAVPHFVRATELDPQSPELLLNLASTLHLLGRLDEAGEAAQRALELAKAAGNSMLAADIRAHLDAYGQGPAP